MLNGDENIAGRYKLIERVYVDLAAENPILCSNEVLNDSKKTFNWFIFYETRQYC